MAELDAESLRRRRRIGVSIATATVLVLVLLLLRECGPCAPEQRAGRAGAAPEVSAAPPGAGAPAAGAPGTAGRAGQTPPGVGAQPPGAAEVARVETLLGQATAGRSGGALRTLVCGDPVFQGERVSTGPESRVGLMRDDVYAQLDSASTIAVDLTPEGALDVSLEAGGVRVVDARSAGPPVRLSTFGATAEFVGGDVDAYSRDGDTAGLICTHGRPLSVAGQGAATTVPPDQCVGTGSPDGAIGVAAAPDAPIRAAAAPARRLALPQSAAEECYVVGMLTPAAFSPEVVAARGDDWLFPGWNPDALDLRPCEDPGSGCTAQSAATPTDPGPPGLQSGNSQSSAPAATTSGLNAARVSMPMT